MEAYAGFAQVYDLFMDNIPYEEWCAYLTGLLREYGIRDGLVLDLGCGTGKLTRLLDRQGYDMIGVDISGEMLEVAMEEERRRKEVSGGVETGSYGKESVEALLGERWAAESCEESGETAPSESAGASSILYLQQDMREFELYGTVRAVVSLCDSMNYLTEYEDLVQVLRLVNNYLDPGGIFIFDMNTPYKYREMLGEQTIAENRDEGSFIWENYFDEETGINEYDLTLFIREADGRYRKLEETHFQRCYDPDTVKKAVEEAGMELVALYGDGTRRPPDEDSERMYFIARERGKTGAPGEKQ